jgi:hypothetical protein
VARRKRKREGERERERDERNDEEAGKLCEEEKAESAC